MSRYMAMQPLPECPAGGGGLRGRALSREECTAATADARRRRRRGASAQWRRCVATRRRAAATVMALRRRLLDLCLICRQI
jgi:hypothetical protein